MSPETPPAEAPDPAEVKRQEKIARDVATALLRTAEIKRQVNEIEAYFGTIKKDNR